jgi:hypothetical protein
MIQRVLLITALGAPYIAYLIALPSFIDAIRAIGTPGREQIVSRGLAFFPVSVSLGMGIGFLALIFFLTMKFFGRNKQKNT